MYNQPFDLDNSKKHKNKNGKLPNPFTQVGTMLTSQQHKNYYSSLYRFGADTELQEYSLPFISGQNQPTQQAGGNFETASGMENQSTSRQPTRLPPIAKSRGPSYADIQEEHYGHMDEDGMGMDEYYDDMERDNMEREEDKSLDVEGLIKMMTADQEGKGTAANARANLFVQKGSYIHQQLLKIKTGEQAISFFAKHGSITPVKFLLCNRSATPPEVFRPYDLLVVSEKQLNSEHFTISAQGVVHILPDKTKTTIKKGRPQIVPTEFFTLSDWMHQSTMFNVISSINFFHHYRIGKVFNIWKGNVRYRLFSKTRQRLANNLIYSKPAFCKAFVDINRVLFDTQKTKVFNSAKTAKPNELDTFVSEQATEREQAKQHYEKKVIEIVNRLKDTVKQVTDSLSLKDQEDLQKLKLGQKVKQKSMVIQKEEDRLKRRVLKIANSNFQMLGTFIRLIDYLEVEILVRINQDSLDSILEEMVEKSRKSCILTQALFQQGMIFQPADQQVLTAFDTLIVEMLKACDSISRVLHTQDFKVHLQNLLTHGGPSVQKIVQSSYSHRVSKRGVQDNILDNFKELQKIVNVKYEKCREIDNFSQQWNFDQYKSQEHSVSEIRAKLEQLQFWFHLINANISSQVKEGIIQLLGRKKKEQLTTTVSNAYSEIMKFLNGLALQKAQNIIKSYGNMKGKLDRKYADLRQFVDYVSSHKQAQLQVKNLGIEKLTLDQMVQTLKQRNNAQSFMPNVISLTGLGAKMNYVQQAILENESVMKNAENNIVENQNNNSEDLNKKIEAVKKELDQLITKIDSETLTNPNTDPQAAIKELVKLRREFDAKQKESNTFNSYQQTLDMQPKEVKQLKEFQKKYETRFILWDALSNWNRQYHSWFNDNFFDLKVDDFERDVKEYERKAMTLRSSLRDRKDLVVQLLLNQVKNVTQYLSLIMDLGNQALEARHWNRIFKLLDNARTHSPNMQLTLSELFKDGITQYRDKVEEISAFASGERNIKLTINEIQKAWDETYFGVLNYRDMKDRFIIGQIDEAITQLQDHQVSIGTMLGSKFVQEIRGQVEGWEKKLSYISDVIDQWLACQRQWMYLENIFSAEDIQKQLPAEATKFQQVDKFWRETMNRTNKNRLILAVTESQGLLGRFQNANNTLEEIQKSLQDYLETKRCAFPRFYFLSNDQLIQILSQTRNPQAVQPHLRKCFDSIAKIKFTNEKNSKNIIGMISAEKEEVPFFETVVAEGKVEHWLLSIEGMMRRTLYQSTKLANVQYPGDGMERSQWLFQYPAQCVLTIDQVKWTYFASEAIRKVQDGKNKDGIVDFLQFSKKQISKMVDLIRGELTSLQRTLMGALIVLDVHARDVVSNMIRVKVQSLSDFEWTRQLRYYWEHLDPEYQEDKDDCVMRQTNTRFVYGYEYLGNGPRLVITPLTDKCYMTLTGAIHLNYGGNPQGPAGTGKTQTTKDLAKAMALQCVVFNCSDGLDYRMMGRFFSGLAQSGAWSCFDEFNRIDIEVLSVIAQQILTIQNAVRARQSQFLFGDRIIPLNPKFGVFITMNPGYAGRTELPDNLKSLFRPISMMVPDYALIAEIILFSQGFTTAHDLARKMVQLYKLSSEQLSKQDHYDFGMRAVKSVLVMAGALRRKNPDLSQDVVLIRAMRDSNVPKFLEQDLPLFMGIVNDLFPSVQVPYVDYGSLQKEIENQLDINNYQKPPRYITKIIQLLETMIVRHGIMLVGVTGTGKTVCSEILRKALTQLKKDGSTDPMHETVHVHTLNPKAVTMGELYGMTNALTGEWTNGLVAKLVRDTVEVETVDKTWIIFDGPVDALWIENMNTVLDDNKMLCLANGERIKLSQEMTMMFEVQDLRVASPATVSRCGMVYLEPVHLGWQPIVDSWSTKAAQWLPASSIGTIVNNLKSLGTEALQFIRQDCKERIPSVDLNLVQSCLNLINSLLDPEKVDLKRAAAPQKIVIVYFLFAFIWSFGANLQDASRPKFNRFLRLKIAQLYTDFPDSGEIYDYCVDPNLHRFVSWYDRIPAFVYNRSTQYFQLLVPTTDTVKYKFMLETLVANGYNLLLTGETGVGKSVIIQDFLNSSQEGIVSAFINFSGKTTSKNLQDVFESKLEKKRKTLLGPPGGKKMIFFLDDVNMPQLDTYGSQPPIELLRQTIDNGGIYDTKKLHFKNIAETHFALACAPPGGGRNQVTPRLFRHFNMIWFPDLSVKSMQLIFTSILRGFLELNPSSGLDIFAESLVRASVQIYQKIRSQLLPTPTKSHYTFNLRDLSKVVQGILQSQLESLNQKTILVQLWLHEEFRVFRDRLINQKDREWFNTNIESLLKRHLDIEWEKQEFVNLLFGHAENEDGHYEKIKKIDDMVPILMDKLAVYSSTYKQMDLVFFSDAIQHLFRASRVLHQNRGNLLLVGVGGSGRSSLARLASFMSSCSIFVIQITKSYREKEFHEDIKNMLRSTGVQGQNVSFIFSDTQIILESFLQDINNILNTGEVPNLFENDQIEQILGDLRPKAKEQKLQTKDAILQFFVQRCRDKLHICLTFSPVGQSFRARCLQFPSIINCCTIDWYNPWPSDALFSVAEKFYAENQTLGDKVKLVCQMCVQIHNSVTEMSEQFYQQLRRKNYTTPTSYLELIKIYMKLLKVQSQIVPGKINRYKSGLKRLKETNQIVSQLKATLIKLQPQIEQSAKETQELVVVLEKKQKQANEKEKIVSKDAAVAQKIFNQVAELRNDCQSKLDEAMPIYHKALAALNTLNKQDITEMKAYTTPPSPLKLVVEAVCLLLGMKEAWQEGRKLMNEPTKFIDKLKNYDKDKIPQRILTKLKKYLKESDFNESKIQSVSKAGVSLYMWVIALDRYSAVMKIIEPKKKDLGLAEKKLKVADDDYNAKKATLQAARDLVAELQADYSAKQKKLEQLSAQRDLIKVQQERAEKLVFGLANQAKRWQESTKILEVDLTNIIGNIILVAGSISYLGPFNSKYRTALLVKWMKKCEELKLSTSSDFSLERIVADPVQVREWNQSGLPGDKLSIENGILLTNSSRWCLIIDPQSQANRFIKNYEKQNKLHVIKLSDAKFLQIMEGGIRMGQPVLLENIDEHLDPAIDPVLLKQLTKGMLRLGDKDIPWSPQFRFYITTKLSNPHYLPEICIKVTILNFTVTPEGLEDQLLVEVVGYEQPQLQEQRDKLITQLSDFKRDLKDIQDRILKLVSDAGEDILDDQELIITLDQSKQMSTAITQRMQEAQVTAKKINDTRELYRSAARRGSVLYFVIADLSLVDPMYQYSLEFFIKLFKRRLQKSKKSQDLNTRLNLIIEDITNAFYENICRGLFEKDKLLYSFLNTSNILRRDGKILADEWNFFLRGTRTDYSDQTSAVNYMDDATWQRVLGLEEAHYNFRDIAESIKDPADGVFWREIMMSDEPHRLPLPTKLQDRLSHFQRLIIIKVLRQEKTIFGAKQFVKNQLGPKFIESPAFDLAAAFEDSSSTMPIIFVLSPGADPLIYLFALAKQREMQGGRLKLLSLGQGQGQIAKRYIEEGQRNGQWVVLQNCHLSISWMPELERIQQQQNEADTHDDYRLWLTSMPSTHFPVPVLQSGIKMTNQPPRGMKANLERTFNQVSDKYYQSSSKPRPFKKLLFALSFFHAVILERRKFGAIGWNIPYQWMTSDFITSDKQLFMYLEEQEQIPYIALNYLIADINYGGRVTDDKDNRLIRAILKKYFDAQIMKDGYKLSSLDTFYAPAQGTYLELRDYIAGLPIDDSPEIFGLHVNANITFQQKITKELMDTIIVIQPRSTGGKAAKTPEEIVADMARQFEMQVPGTLDLKKAHTQTFKLSETGAMLSLGVFLGQQIDRFNRMLKVIKKSLNDLQKAIKGTVVMSIELEAMFNGFLIQKVPRLWEKVAYLSLKPLGSWVTDMIARVEFLRDWLERGPPISYWVPAFFFPQGFMTATLQTYARKTMIPIDTLKFRTQVQKQYFEDFKMQPTDGVAIRGLFLQGAKWSMKDHRIDESDAGQLFQEIPVVWLEPVKIEHEVNELWYQCPLYKTTTRAGELSTTGHSTNFILYLDLPSVTSPDHWIRRGVALLCQLDD